MYFYLILYMIYDELILYVITEYGRKVFSTLIK